MAIGRHQVIHDILVAAVVAGDVDEARLYRIEDAASYGDLTVGLGTIQGLIAHDGTAWQWIGRFLGSGSLAVASATIATGAITLSPGSQLVDLTGEGAADDILSTINGTNKGDRIMLQSAANDIEINEAGNLRLGGLGEFHLLNAQDKIELLNSDGTNFDVTLQRNN